MNDKGIISNEMLEWSDMVKTLRNNAAHANASNTTKQEAKDALDFFEAIAENIYDLRPKFEAIKNRKLASSKTKVTSNDC